MEIGERIAAIIKVNQHTAASFADAVGVQRSAVSHILNGRNKPSLDFLQKVLLHFPRVDAGWLITGKSPGKNTSTDHPTADAKELSNDPPPSPEAGHLPEEAVISAAEKSSGKTPARIVVFYTDRTFDTYEPN